MKKFLRILSILLFVSGIALGIIGNEICTRDTQNYQELQPELFAPESIAAVLYDDDLKQLYVCYNDASYVNVYTDSGEFLWAVSTPYLRNSHFVLQDENLIIYNDKAYVYNSANGNFIECVNADDLDIDYEYDHAVESEKTDGFKAGEFYFSIYQVYKARSDGSLEIIVSRPWWYGCFYFPIDWCIAFTGGVGFIVSCFIDMRKNYNLVKNTLHFTKPGARLIFNYFKATSIVHIVYCILDIILGFYGGILCVGIIPLALHFMISSAVFSHKLKRISLTKAEETAIHYWEAVEVASFCIAFASVILAVLIVSY